MAHTVKVTGLANTKTASKQVPTLPEGPPGEPICPEL